MIKRTLLINGENLNITLLYYRSYNEGVKRLYVIDIIKRRQLLKRMRFQSSHEFKAALTMAAAIKKAVLK